MDFSFYQELFFRPIFNLLVYGHNILPGDDFGLAIILVTVAIRLILSPLSLKALISQKKLSGLQPKIKELQEKHKGDKQALGQATMRLYKENNVNLFGGCLPILIQIPILLGLYQALASGFGAEALTKNLYQFVKNPGFIKEISLGLVNLTRRNIFLALAAGLFQFLQSKMAGGRGKQVAAVEPTAGAMAKQMLYVFPAIVVVIAWNLPAGIVIYWITTTLFSIAEQYYINRKLA